MAFSAIKRGVRGQNIRGARPHRRTRYGWSPAPGIEALEERRILSASPSPTALTPAEIRAYYGFNNIAFPSSLTVPILGHHFVIPIMIPGDGTGQTIAILDKYSDPDISNDVGVFDKQFHLPAVNLTVVGGVTATDPTGGWEDEESLDVEWAHAIAPGANIVVVNYTGNEASFLSAVNTAKNYPGVSVVSMSSGDNEFTGELADDSTFTSPTNHNGVNVSFVAASGDDKTADALGPIYPSASPDVLAVGGTVLNLSASGNVEMSWDDSEGGKSADETEPRYQELVQQWGFRTTPDVAFAATNFAAYDSFPYLNTTTNTSAPLDWHTPAGTSIGTPQWAALIAIANQGRVIEGKPTLSDVPQVFYTLPASDFNDIVSGPADREGNAPGPGYDLITGLGTPKANLIAQALLNPPFFVFPPYVNSLAASAGDANGPSHVPQAMLDEVGRGVASPPAHVGAMSQSAGSIALTVSPVATISSEPAIENGLVPLPASGVPTPPAATGLDGWTSWSPIETDFASVNDRSSLILLLSDPVVGPGVGDASAAPISPVFAGQQVGSAFPPATVVEVVDQVDANATIINSLSQPVACLEDGIPTAGTALFTQATDGCFERNTWIVDGPELHVATVADVNQRHGAAPAFMATAGIVSAWLMRRWRTKQADESIAGFLAG